MAIFSQDALAQVVASTLPADPRDGERVVVGTVDETGAQIVASFKFKGGKWEAQAAARHDWNGENSVGAKVLLRW